MELLKLSKFKLQLQALTTELRDLREREHSATEQCRILIQKQKQTEEEYGRKLQELQTELASSNELHQKLERKVNYLQNDNALLENRQKELQGTIQTLLQSRENFVNAYEALAGLRSKMDTVSAFEKVFVEKVHCLENQLKNNEDELKRRDNIISELEAQLEAEKIRNTKDAVIQNLICEKEALHCEVRKLALILQKVKETVIDMDEEQSSTSPSHSPCSELQSAVHDSSIAANNGKRKGRKKRLKDKTRQVRFYLDSLVEMAREFLVDAKKRDNA
ncbi:hypothetical protein JCGZ_21730 [Jatropha curcas]|uniref:Uncharacterized protein n=1 Tax=Jatropha curcas TaxID=180498 RepID=A0A067JP19_JATCU|nr:hypothetical protein JCGZ_21730 [Jatropha curcas]